MSMTRDEINKAMSQEGKNATSAMYRYESCRNTFNAASFEGDTAKAEEVRQQMHALLDIMLDSAATSMMLQRQMMELG